MGGSIWTLVSGILNTLKATGVALLVIFFFYGIIKSSVSFRDILRQPTQIIGLFIRIILAKFLIDYGAELLLKILAIVQELISSIHTSTPMNALVVPPELADLISNAGFWEGLGAWCASFLGTLVVYLLSIIIMVIVYGRFFKIYLLTAISPLPLSGLSSEATEYIGLNFLKSYTGECLRGVLILVSCRIFSAFAISSPALDPTATAGAAAWLYVAQIVMNLLILVILVKTSDRMVKEIFGI